MKIKFLTTILVLVTFSIFAQEDHYCNKAHTARRFFMHNGERSPVANDGLSTLPLNIFQEQPHHILKLGSHLLKISVLTLPIN